MVLNLIMYTKKGNWNDVNKYIQMTLQKSPKSVYFGDNPLQNIYAPTSIPLKMDVIAVIKEIACEVHYADIPEDPYGKYISSKFWGPFLFSNGSYTFIGDVPNLLFHRSSTWLRNL